MSTKGSILLVWEWPSAPGCFSSGMLMTKSHSPCQAIAATSGQSYNRDWVMEMAREACALAWMFSPGIYAL